MGTFKIYKDAAGEWRWRLEADNGNIIATSGEGYKNSLDCVDIVHRIKLLAGGAEVMYAR